MNGPSSSVLKKPDTSASLDSDTRQVKIFVGLSSCDGFIALIWKRPVRSLGTAQLITESPSGEDESPPADRLIGGEDIGFVSKLPSLMNEVPL